MQFFTTSNQMLFSVTNSTSHYFYNITTFLTSKITKLATVFKETLGDGFWLLLGLFLVFSADVIIIDDEPL